VSQSAPVPLRPSAAPRSAPNNLPTQITSFVGRERDLAEIADLLRESTRLVTLTGAGGVGKTRLGLEVASELGFDFPDGVFFVDLAPIVDARRVLPTISTVLGIYEEPGRELADTLSAALRVRHLLLVLDNCEHLIDDCAKLAHHLLTTSRQLVILATSREPLNVTGETTWRVPSLEQFDAVRLFEDRTTAAVPGLDLTADAGRTVARICQRLDGIPLALELAAARVPALGLQEIALRLDDRFRLLVGGSRAAPPRQQTLRAVVEWSYDLLGEHERQLFEGLSVFAGGWSLDAAESICGTDLNVLARLVDKSLVVADIGPMGTWYRMLETVRAYATERLRASDALRAFRDRHLNWYVELAEKGEHVMRRDPDLSWETRIRYAVRLRQEMDNLRAAWGWSLDGGDRQCGLRLASALFPYFYSQGELAEGRDWFAALLDQTSDGAPTVARAAALSAASKLAAHHGDDRAAQRYAEEFEASPGELRSLAAMADVHAGLSMTALRRGNVATSRAHAAAALELSRRDGDRVSAAMWLCYLGAAASEAGDLEDAASLYHRARDECRAMDFRLGAALALEGLGGIARTRRDAAGARHMYEEALAIFRDMHALMQAGQVQIGLGYTALDQQDSARALDQFTDAAELLAAVGQRQLLSQALEGLALAKSASDRQTGPGKRTKRVLTEREVEVARLLGRGLSNREIAGVLVISVRTADRHVENILGKLGLRSRGAVAAWAVQQGLLQQELV
jgi:predicted ATPase/DNA-binding CsgD family transcriptional regulator